MAFIDDFSGSIDGTQLENHTPSGGTAWTLGVEGFRSCDIYSSRLSSTTTAGSGRGYWLCDDQGSANHATLGKQVGFGVNNTELAVRVVDKDTHASLYIGGVGGAGRRLTKRVSGVSTDLVTSQAVQDEWRKIEAEGDKYRMYVGGTGASPAWVLVGSEQTISDADIPTTETSQGVIGGTVGGADNGNTHTYFEAVSLAAGVTYTLDLTSGSYASTGNTQQLTATRSLNTTSGSYSYTGNTANVTADRLLNTTSGSYATTGNTEDLVATRLLNTTSGSYTTTGGTFELTAAFITGFTLDILGGVYTLSGGDIALTADRSLNTNSGSYSYTGNTTDIVATRLLQTVEGVYNTAGNTADVIVTRLIKALPGGYTVGGNTAGLVWSGEVTVKAVATNGIRHKFGNVDAIAKGTISDFTYVSSLADLPTPSAGLITLLANHTYYFCGSVDLLGNRLKGAFNTCILGSSSENAFITSTGLGVGVPLFYSEWTTPIRHVTFHDVDTALEIQGAVNGPVALDWTGVNFADVPNVGLIDSCSNFVFTKGAFLTAQNIRFDGTMGTLSFADSLFQGSGVVGTLMKLEPTLVIERRFRVIYSSFVAFGSTAAIDVSASATIPTESFILDTVNFSGGGVYLVDVNQTSNTALFQSCKGIINTSVNAQLYMRDNATVTPVAATDTFYKILGTSIPSVDNSKYDHANNRLTNRATVERKYLISAQLSFTSGNLNVCEFGFFDSKLGTVREPSRTKGTANSAGRLENMSFSCVVQHSDGDYLEIHGANTTSTTDITVDSLNFVITEIQ